MRAKSSAPRVAAPDRAPGGSALAEVMHQFDEEDELASLDDPDDLDYVDDGVADEDEMDEIVDGNEAKVPAARHHDDDSSAQSSDDPEIKPKVHRSQRVQPNEDTRADATYGVEDGAPVAGSFLEGFPIFWRSWEQFEKVFADFQERTFQLFSCRTSTSVEARNRMIVQEQTKAKKVKDFGSEKKSKRARRTRTGGNLLPASWDKYSRTFLCTHAMPFLKKGTGKRKHTSVRSTGCSAHINARVCLRPSSDGFHLVVKATGTHDHALTEHQWYNYAENRRIEDPLLCQDVEVISKAGAKPRGILSYLRAKTGKRTALKDVHNMIQGVKHTFRGGRSDAERAIAVLDEFIESASGNTAEFIVDSDNNIVWVVTFQSARQKRLFAAFPEVVLVDSTHGTNANRYKLFSFAVHDVFGRGQYVQHALVQTEEKANLALAVAAFKKNNPGWSNIRVLMTDKALHEKDVLHEGWPNARQLLCRWHVETWLKRQCSLLGGVGQTETKQLKVIMKGLVNAESQHQYNDFKEALLMTLDNDKDNHLYKSVMQHWDTTTDEWVMFKRGGVPHLKNNTNNHLESKWGRVKEVVDGNFTIDELVSMLITLQDYAEERYLAEFHRVGSRPPMTEDPELTALAMQLSDYAFRMVAEQHKLAGGPSSSYDIERDGEQTTLTNPATGEAHVVDARLSSCDCIFSQTCLLPCRHVMHVRSKSNYETVIPPMRTFSSRWIVHSPANNIDEGDVIPGGLNRINCPSIRALPPVDRDTKYSRSKQLTEKINDVISIQPSSTYRLAMTWLQDFHTALRTGKLEEFTGRDVVDNCSGFPSLSQISVPDSVTISQLSFTDPGVPVEAKSLASASPKAEVAVKAPMPAPASSIKETTKIEGCSNAPIVFASPPKRKGMSKRAEKKDESKKEMKEAKRIMSCIQEGKKARAVKLCHMEILSGPYTRKTTIPLVNRLDLTPFVISGVLVVRRYTVGQPQPVITSIPQAERIRQAIQAIEETNNHELLARWDDYGCATYEQLKLMEGVVMAKNNFNLVQLTVDWIDKAKFRADCLVEPFKDTHDVLKIDHKNAVEDLNLGRWYVGKHAQFGSEFLDFRENLWLHSGSIIGALFMLRETYQYVGVANPRFLDFETTEQRTRLASSYGVAVPGNKSVISVVNLGHHWGAFFIDVHGKRCFLFDPMQLKSNITTLKNAVRMVIEPVLDKTDQLQFDVSSNI
ncbi:Zinc finger SWIM domain-containing protein 3 [Phytophthora ramorum]|uniref:Zinc finger SWIM domain-containing protein 3 n=1 Tax=Phytophthora ramorum TaxID=164328 RepID=UPI0030AC1410|nr:Zinc finger SWIM domain-containing protein 3 [Phytophthora ramorum]